MANTSAFFPNSTLLRPRNPLKSLDTFPTHFLSNYQHHRRKKHPSFLALASSIPLPINVDYLEKEFSSHGVSFESIGDSCVVKMGLENGSKASLMLPSGLITSYKPLMWHGTTFEVLHTTVSEGEKGEAVIQGGLSVNFKCLSDGGLPWSPSTWALNDVRGSSGKSIQVELASISPEDMVEVRCFVTLREDLLASELAVMNPKSSPLELSGSVISHLKVSTPDATYAIGLQGSSYHGKQPLTSEFSIIPPDFGRKGSIVSNRSLAEKALQGVFSSWQGTGEKDDKVTTEGLQVDELEGEEDDDYAHMTETMSRIYTTAPREFTIIDRGRRNSIVIRRTGFDELYIFSPGSKHEFYGKYAYICLGPTATLTPVVLGPGGVWRGAQYLHNPNL